MGEEKVTVKIKRVNIAERLYRITGEGIYTHTFSGNRVATPRYDYNQIMYRLNLDDPRLKPVREW